MARRRFFVPQVRRGIAELAGPDAEHLVRVLRAEVGQIYEISDNQRLYLAEVTTARKSSLVFQVKEELPVPCEQGRLLLLPALIKFERFEWLLEKATELGVTEIQPLIATRSERGLEQAALKRMPRWERIALEASQQSRRARLPVLHAPVKWESALKTGASKRLLLDEDPAAPPILDQLGFEQETVDSVALLLGPEGGWTEEERDQALQIGWLPSSFGRTVLRAETAGAAGLAITQAAWERSRSAPDARQREAS